MARLAKRISPNLTCDGARQIIRPSAIRPMLATVLDKPFSDPNWLFETKWDGVRAICFIDSSQARFVSRNQLDMTPQYPELAHIPDCVTASQAILDGEIVALDEKGISRFQLLQPRLGRKHLGEIQRLAARTRLAYYVFDLLYLDGFDLTGCELVERKSLLYNLLNPSTNVRYSEHIVEQGEELYREVAKIPLGGIIAKRLNSSYVQRRSADWLKIKTLLQSEVVVGGYTEPRKTRAFFGALVVGLYQEGKFHYVGHTGGGFNEKMLESLYRRMQPLKINKCPFVEEPKTNEAVQWIQPKLVAQIKFSEWTADRRMRQPTFLGLREDKQAEQCTFEREEKIERVLKQQKARRSRKASGPN